MLEDMPERMSQDMSDRMSEDMSERMPDIMSGDMPERMSETMSKDMSERMSKDMSERMSEDCLQPVCEVESSRTPFRRWVVCLPSPDTIRLTYNLRWLFWFVMVGITRSKVIGVFFIAWPDSFRQICSGRSWKQFSKHALVISMRLASRKSISPITSNMCLTLTFSFMFSMGGDPAVWPRPLAVQLITLGLESFCRDKAFVAWSAFSKLISAHSIMVITYPVGS